MPKKSGKNVRESRIGKRINEAATKSTSNELITNKTFRNVRINVKNAKRWFYVKKRLEFVTDDELATYLLDLAESIVRRDGRCASAGDWKTDQDKENDLESVKVDEKETFMGEEPLRRSPRKQLPAASAVVEAPSEIAKNDESAEPEIPAHKVSQSHEKRKSRVKHHKTKGKHHRDKRGRRKHSKNCSDKNLAEASDDRHVSSFAKDKRDESEAILKQRNVAHSRIPKLHVEPLVVERVKREIFSGRENPRGVKPVDDARNDRNETSGCVEKNLFQDKDVPAVNATSKLGSNDNFEASTMDGRRRVQNDSTKQSSENIFADKTCNADETKLGVEIQSVQQRVERTIDDKKTKKKRKHSKQSLPLDMKIVSVITQSEIPHKRHKKKHKYPTLHKKRKYHDVRKAPENGRAAGLQDLESPELDIILPPEALSTTDPPSQTFVENSEISGEPHRLAIKIKLCSDCNDRHVEDACPLNSTEYVIPDALSRAEWLKIHERNSEVAKAVNSDDPMSEGYAIFNDDAEDSDDEAGSADQCRTKAKNEGEEKQLHVNDDRPLYSRDSLPDCLELRITNTDHGIGVYARQCLPVYAKLGPLVGNPVKEMDIPDDFTMRHIWELEDNGKTSYVSTTNPLTSNWIRYMRPADTKDERTVAVVTNNGELHLVTTRNITTGMELTYWADSQSSTWTRKNKTDKTNCGGCNLNFSHPIYYRLHCCIFHDTNYSLTIRKYHCKICGEAVLGKDNIMKHAADLHGGRGAYQCQYCRKFFLRLNYLEMHRTYGCSQNPQRSRPLCDFCGRKFCQPQKLKVHIKRMHSDMSEVLREFQCKLCLKLLGSRAALQRHMKEVHHKDVVAAATCDRCGKMFQNKSNLKIHMLTHSGVKPFKCKEKGCKAAFTTKQCLQFHYKKVHGLTEEMMPKIERSVAYTFDAYSGGLVEDVGGGHTSGSGRRGSQDNSNGAMSLDDCSSEHSSRADASVSSFQATINEFETDVVATSTINPDRDNQDYTIEERDLRENDLQESQNSNLPDHEMENRDLYDREIENRDLHDRQMENRDLQNRQLKNRDLQNRQIENRDLQNRETENSHSQDHEIQNNNLRDNEIPNCNVPDHDLQNRDSQNREIPENDFQDRQMENRDLQNRKIPNNDFQDLDMQNRDPHGREMQNRDLHDHDLHDRDLPDEESPTDVIPDRKIKQSPIHTSHQDPQASSSTASPLENLRPSTEVDFYGISRLPSKGSKKWMGEFNPPAETDIIQQPLIPPSRDVYEFDDNTKKDQNRTDVMASSLINGDKLGLNIYRRPESTNASLLVEAALDAAERDIGAVTSPMLEENDRDNNLYAISNQLQSPLPSRSMETHLDAYMQQHEDLMSPTPNDRKNSPVQMDYHLHRPIDYINSPRTSHNMEQYLQQDEMPRVCSPNAYIQLSQEDLTSPSATPNPHRYPGIHHHHHHHHHHQVPTENLSSDEGDSVAQNLSLSVKEKSLQLDLSSSYKYESLDGEFCRDRGNFEPLVLNAGELQGLDMSARGFHHGLGAPLPNARYHHHLYEITERQTVDLSRTSGYSMSPPSPPPPAPSTYAHNEVLRIVSLDLTPSHSVDLSLSRSHHVHGGRIVDGDRTMIGGGNSQGTGSGNSHVVPDAQEGRILSPPSPPPPSAYNANYPVSPAAYHPPRPGYHHYSGYY